MSKDRLCVVIPYRNREKHLELFIAAFPMLCGRENFKINVIEQWDSHPFIRGAMFNIGFLENPDFDTYCFHDVDMLPVIADYSEPETPAHLAMYATQFPGNNPGDKYYGGVNLFKKEHFKQINGFSNSYPVWGSEDDDLRHRVLKAGFPLNKRHGFFKSLPHPHIGPTHEFHQKNLDKLNSLYDFSTDGLSSIKYTVESREALTNYCDLIKVKLCR